MKFFGNISNNSDLVNKKYVDDHSSGTGNTPNDGNLLLGVNNEEPSRLFTANQSSDSTLTFIAGTGITLSRSNSTITITNSGSGGNSSYHIYSSPTDINSLNASYKNHVVVLAETQASSGVGSSEGSGSGIRSYTFGFSSSPSISIGYECFVYVTASDTNCQLAIPNTLSVGGVNKIVLYSGYYSTTTVSNIINFVYSSSTVGTPISSLVLHIFYDGTYFYIDRLHYSIPSE